MGEKTRKIYTLKHNSVLDGVETVIPFNGENGERKDKLTLTEIDAYTTLFDSSSDLMYGLNSIGYSFYNSHFFIEYHYNHQRKKTELIFSDQTLLRQFALNNLGENTIKCDISFHRYLYSLTEEAEKDPEMLKYLRDNNYISSWLKQNIEEYNIYKDIDVDVSHINISRIKKELKSYKTIRNIEIGKREYEKYKQFIQQMEEKKKKLVKKPRKPKNYIEGQGQLFDPDNY